MHELAIAEEVIRAVTEHAAGRSVARVVLEIGRLSAVLPEAVRFCFEACIEGTELAGARLEIVETPGAARCRACGSEVALERPYGRCGCGSSDLEWLRGEALKVLAIEVAACA